MSPIDPRELKATRTGSVISDHRACPKCGYDLLGLRTGDACPECGRVIASPPKRKSRVLTMADAAPAELRRLMTGLGFLFFSMLLSIGSFAASALVDRQAPPLLGLVLGAAWFAGVVLVTPPRRKQDTGGGTAKGLRWSARITQAGWLGASAISMIVDAASPGGWVLTTLQISAMVLLWGGTLGMLPLVMVLRRLAEWGMDDSLSERLRFIAMAFAAFGFAFVTAGVTAELMPPVSYAAGLVVFVTLWLVIISTGLLLHSLWKLVGLTLWAQRAIAANEAKEARVRERAEAARARTERERVPVAPAFELKDGFVEPEPTVKPAPTGGHTHRIDARDDGDPYELSPD
ncbi:MAG: hypothetical protein ACF8SC_09730 [Phycisphaerales bacterium JB037]